MQFPHLFAPGRIGTLHLPNRILMGSMHLGYEGVAGGTERMAEFYAARTRGGAALIITGGCAINEEAIGGAQFSCIYRAEDVEALSVVVNQVHQANGSHWTAIISCRTLRHPRMAFWLAAGRSFTHPFNTPSNNAA